MFTHYKYVHALSEAGSFTKAAQTLYISQPALSMAIRSTEEKVGAVLFERTGRGIRLTPAGEAYLHAARQILQLEEDLQKRISDINGLQWGSVSVAGSTYLSAQVLPKIINAFTAQHPHIQVTLAEASSQELARMLRDDQVELVVDNLRCDDGWQSYPLVQEHILLCVPKEKAVNEALKDYQILPQSLYTAGADATLPSAVSIDAFREEDFVLLRPENDMYQRAMELFSRAQITPRVKYQVDQLNLSYAFTASGLGVSFITDTFFRHAQFADNVVLYNTGLCRTLCIAHKRKKYLSRAMAEFIRIAKQVMQT